MIAWTWSMSLYWFQMLSIMYLTAYNLSKTALKSSFWNAWWIHYITFLHCCHVSFLALAWDLACAYITAEQFLKNILISWLWQCQLLKVLLHSEFDHKKNECLKWEYFFHWIWHHLCHSFYQDQNENTLSFWSWKLIDLQWAE